ncbi:hypothetical protein [Phocaeicola coprophilus]|uniref:hypothetical protein n=1 Tax=Phocaeicola coprophilus TaxID=387090 RepID=UPI00255CE06E|nr:hypothetical protein [Phocaeicola coprophilus]
MKKLSCYIGLLMATLWLAACKSDTPLEPETTVGDGEQVLEITVDGDFYASSRSTAESVGYKLVSSQAIQHIEHLYAYIFKGSVTDAKCVYVTEIPWEQNSQQGSASLTYRLKEANLPQYVTDGKPNDMQVLVVAVDNNTDTYNFPYGEVANHADNTNQEGNNAIIGKSLNAVKLKLAEAAVGTTTSDADKAFKMANTEVFSGCTSFRADDQIIKVSLQRCVAGVLCYLTDIPYYVGSGTDEDNNKISSIELQLGNNLNLNTEYASFYDGTKFGSAASNNNNVIASVNILEYIYGKGTTNGTLDVQEEDIVLDKSNQRLYVPAMDNGVVKTKENTILFGAYLLPIENTPTADKTKATLKLVLKSNGGDQTAFIVKNTVTSVPGEPDASGSPTTITESAYAYSLKANRLYSIGSKPFATDTDADQPASLKGKEVELNVIDWTDGNKEGQNNVNFPVYSLKSTISADWDTQYENYIFNCMSETRRVYIYPSEEDAQSLNFKVQVAYSPEFENNPWVKFRFINEETWKPFEGYDDWYTTIGTNKIPTELKGKTRMALEVRLNDYVKENDILGKSSITDKKDALLKDFRTANLQLVNSSNAEVLSSVPIQQFNAITVKFDYDKKSYTVGFSRVDLWDTMADNGVAKGEGRYDTWGFPGIVIPWNIYGTTYDSNVDGEVNSNDANKEHHKEFYETSALYYARVKSIDDELGDERYWYLPAREELGAFFNEVVKEIENIEPYYNVNNLIEVVNVHHDAFYWTSSSDGSDNGRKSYVMKDTDEAPSGMRRYEYAYCRQARKFN